ncbi:MAG: discoidin domain-containing protein [Oscillospiraceae bacterium]|nr:discoidin domain-containing protein [Oscillospiraceae bacterium]
MRRSVWMRVLAAVLIISMLAAPVSAAARRPSPSYGTNCIVGGIISIIRDIIRDIWDDWFDVPGDEDPEPTPPEQPTDPTDPTEPGETEPEDPTEPEETLKTVMNLIEGYTNTENGHLLRGVSYSLSQLTEEQSKPESTPGSLRDIKAIAIGAARAAAPSVRPMAETETTPESVKIEGITGKASSVDTSEPAFDKSVDNAFDGDYSTFWATVPGGNLAACYLIADLRSTYTIDKVQYTKRHDASAGYNCTGNLLNYTIEVSTNGLNWTQVDTGDTVNGTTEITFDAVSARYVRLTSTSSYHWQDGTNGKPDNRNTVMTCAEFEVFGYSNPTTEPDPDPDMPDPGIIESIPFSKLTWAQVKNANFNYYVNDSCTNPVKVVAKADGSGYELVDSQGNVLATLDGSDLSQKIGNDIMLFTPSYIVFFPVTMYDYDQSTINNATHALEAAANPALTKWQGIYFNGGSPIAITYGNSRNNWVDGGQYVIQSARAAKYIDESYLSGSVSGGITGVTRENATVWNLQVVSDTTGYLSTVIDGITYYMAIDSAGASGESLKTSPSLLTITTCSDTTDYVDGDGNLLQICGTKYLNQHGGYNVTTYGGENSANDSGNAMWFYKVDGETDNKVTAGSSITAGFADWNFWGKNSGNNANGDLFYTGLVENELVNDEIVFTKPDGGIFNSNTDVKDIYEFVGVPFILNTETGVYSFDSDYHGAYFSGEPQSGTKDAPHNLHFALEAPQPMPNGLSVGDGSTNAFLPFNNQESYAINQVNYHFGMRADLPFSMTSNGRIKETDDNSTPITFTFSGDDDVWIFIDGKLVADLGGIHNRLDVTFDFAANTVTYSEENIADFKLTGVENNETGSYNDSTFATTQKLFNDTEGTGLLGMTRQEFATNENHELQFFYLERGEGTSNCHIEFNLPMRDTVLVTKDITKSWSQEQADNDDDGDGTAPLTSKEQEAVNKLDFYFKLWKKEAGGEFQVVANTNYILQDKEGNFLGIHSTGSDGKFSLKNAQTAKFMTEIPRTGVTYYVEEIDLDLDTFLTPDYNYKGQATYGFNYEGDYLNPTEDDENNTSHVNAFTSDASLIPEHELPMNAEVLKSYEFLAKGSIESSDYLEFICTNYLNAELPNPTARAYEDIIVIDYGLPVQVDPLHNDLFRGDDIEIVAWGDETLELNEVLTGDVAVEDGTEGGTSWTGNKFFSNTTTEAQVFDSGKVTFTDETYAEHAQEITNDDGTKTTTYTYTRDSFDYELTKQMTEVEEIRYIIKVTSTRTNETTGLEYTACRYALGKVYIVPATIMYYEENFDGLVSYATEAGSLVGEQRVEAYVSDYQEPGVVGTVGDSTYGSDEAYECDPHDSNGTSYKLDTTNGYVRFAYSFTGTGTSFFARTSGTTGYMQVMLFDGELDVEEAVAAARLAEQKDIWYRDTFYNDTNNTNLDGESLYNIPVFTNNELHYGTYTILVTVAQAGTQGAGPNLERSGNEFYLDGIRVMQPLNESNNTVINEATGETITDKALSAYAADGESNLVVETLRQKLITDVEEGEAVWDGENFVVLTDTNGAITAAQDYISFGPKEEVYLAPGQKVTFSMKYWEPQGLKIYMGMKAPFGTVGTDSVSSYSAKLNVGKNTFTLRNATDCYYDVTDMQEKLEAVYIQATDDNGYLLYTDADGNEIYMNESGEFRYRNNNELYTGEDELTPVNTTEVDYYVITYTFEATESIVALTNIKVVGNFEFTIVEKNEETQDGPGTAEQ